jgi:hypothetical protein
VSLDKFLHAQYHKTQYNCGHFACDVYNYLTGADIEVPTGTVSTVSLRRFVNKLSDPVSPCLAVMSRPHYTTHVGVYINGKIMHLTEQGARIEDVDVASLLFSKVRFYTC